MDTWSGGKGQDLPLYYLANKLCQQKKWVLRYICDERDDRHNRAEAVLTGFVYKLLVDMNEYLHDFPESTKSDEIHSIVHGHLSAIAKGNEPPHEGLWLAFKHIICKIQTDVYIVLDGLAECDKNSIDFLIQKFRMMFSSNFEKEDKLRILIVSRHWDIGSNLTIDLHKYTQSTQCDLLWHIYQCSTKYGLDGTEYKSSELYQQYQSGELKKLHQKGKLCSILLDRADKTYLWTALAMDLLNSDIVREILDSEYAVDKFLLEGLHAMINRGLLEALEGEDEPRRKINLEDMARIIRWVSLAFRPLTAAELRATIKVTDDSIRKLQHILSLSTKVNEGKDIDDKTELRLIHLSLKEYFLRPSHKSSFSSSIGLLLRPYLLGPVGHLVRLAKDGPFLEHCLAAAVPLALRIHPSYTITIPVVAGYVSMLWKEGPRKFHPARSFLEKLHQSLKKTDSFEAFTRSSGFNSIFDRFVQPFGETFFPLIVRQGVYRLLN